MRGRRSDPEGAQAPRWRTRLFVGALVLATMGALLSTAYAGWWLHDRNPGRPIEVNVKRPVTVIREAGTAAGTVPNVLGLDVDTARQAMVDAGVVASRIVVRERPYAGEVKLIVDQDPGPGASRAGVIVLSSSRRATMPAVVGKKVEAVRKQLSDLGARVVVRSAFASGRPEGTVVSTRPAAGGRLASDTTLTVAEAPSSVFLSELEAISSDCNPGELNIGGRAFKNALSCSPGTDTASAMSYTLNRRVSQFVATVGLSDRSSATAPVRFRVFVDGRLRATQTVAFGRAVRMTVPVAGAVRMRMEAQVPGGRDLTDSVTAGWGNARFLGGRSAIDAVVKESGP